MFIFFIAVNPALALEMPVNASSLDISNVTAKAYLVLEESTGKTLLSKNNSLFWPPASLTKLVTAMVVLENNPNLEKVVSMSREDEVGGSRLKTKVGVKYSQKDLLHASLISSYNNATMALVRSTGLKYEDFVKKMNQKAKDLGAENSLFFEPTGINEKNVSTVVDIAKIAQTAFSHPVVKNIVAKQKYYFSAKNNKKYSHSLKTTNKLLGDAEIKMLAGKTGYLEESDRNFVGQIETLEGKKILVVIFGSQTGKSQFLETKELAMHAILQLREEKNNILGLTIKN
jgi:D-alanyl-D-alanine endopeptidase (penicillin-binding protein 7)